MAEQLTGIVIAEKYRVDSLLRSGELGDFYRGRHIFMDKPVVLKILPRTLALDENSRDLFAAEAKNASLISHPNILAVTDFGLSQNDSSYIVFEDFEGERLKQSIIRDGQFSVYRSVTIARQIAEALSSAHEKGFVHGSLTPDSVLTTASPSGENVKVFDFEPSTNGGSGRGNERSSANVAYLAPEQFAGLRNVDGRSDIYSLGIILYQMLAGEVPFKGETPTDVMLKHAEELPLSLSTFRTDVPSSLEAAIQKALAKDPDQRFQSAGEFVEELDKTLTANSPASKNSIWKAVLGVLAGISLLAVALIYATSVKQTDPTTQLRPDLNGQPVQPINPATGTEEQALAMMPSLSQDSLANSNMAQPPGTLPGGDNYNPWATGAPPVGAPLPNYVPPGGQVYSIDPNTGSPFMPGDGTVILVPVPANANTAAKPTPTPKVPAANVNVQTAPPVNTAAKPSSANNTAPIKDAKTSKPATPKADVQTKKSGTPKSPEL